MNEELIGGVYVYDFNISIREGGKEHPDWCQITSDHVYSEDFEKLKEEVEIIKRKTDSEYAKECVKNELLEKYKKLVMSDIWWEACRAWIHLGVDKIIEKYKYSFGYSGLQYSEDYSIGFTDRSILTMPSSSSDGMLYYADGMLKYRSVKANDIILATPSSVISINELLNPNPEIEGYDFEKFVVNYCNK